MSGLSLNGVELINIACPLFVLVWAYLWGPVWGAMGGLVLGICISLSNPAMFTFTGALAISGLTAGLLRPYHRLWAALGYFAVLRFLSYYSFEGGYILTSVWEDSIVIIAFLLVPFSFWSKLKSLSIFWPFNIEGEDKLRFTMAARIKDFAAVFKELAVTFRPLNEEDEVRSKRDLSPLVDFFCRKVCSSCEYFERCWQKDLYNQYRRVISMLSAVDDDEKFMDKYIPVRLKRYCPRQREIVKTVGNMKEIYRLNCHWQDKIHESRSLVSEQLEGISFVMHDLAQELKLQPGEKAEKINENERLRFLVEIGVAQVARDGEGVSGDSYAVLPLKQGKQAIVLSDGMGSGKDARMASLSTVKLMEHLLGVGFRREVVINTINTLLRLGYPTERFATLDLALLDLHSGEADLYKLGAPPSFFKKGDAIRVIGSSSLPIGILEDITPEKESFTITDGGILVMVTDGLTDSRPESDEDWIVNALSGIRHDHPQIIADRLIEEACYRWPRGVQDDLTVLVARLKPFELH
jgi:stage II sporulation protein E